MMALTTDTPALQVTQPVNVQRTGTVLDLLNPRPFETEYQLIEEIGKGVSSVVFLARRYRDRAEFAVKLIPMDKVSHLEWVSTQ